MLKHFKMDGSAGQVCRVVESDDMLRLVVREGTDCVSVFMTEEIADRICAALCQLLTDKVIRRNPALAPAPTALPDQVERAEQLADAPPRSAADMSEGELILGRRVPSEPKMVVHVARWRERGEMHMRGFNLPIGSDYVAAFWHWHSKLGFNDMVSDLVWK